MILSLAARISLFDRGRTSANKSTSGLTTGNGIRTFYWEKTGSRMYLFMASIDFTLFKYCEAVSKTFGSSINK